MFSSPHIHGGDSIRKQMLTVILALMPATFMSVYLFGWLACLVLTCCILSSVLSEYICLKLMDRRKRSLLDGSAALTGLFVGLVLPVLVPWWMAILGSALAIVLGKQLYGGLGYNPFNPALTARIILLISFPVYMTSWAIPMPLEQAAINFYDFSACWQVFFTGVSASAFDAVSMATPLGHVKTALTQQQTVSEALASYQYQPWQAFIGLEAGSLGETSVLAILLGAALLLGRNLISWHIPTAYILTVALLATVFNLIEPDRYAPALFHVLAGGLVLCAFFMATDPVTSPVTPIGQLVFGIGCGVITWCIRTYANYPEGAMFAVVVMNCAVPLIDHYCRPRVYGR
ncbi:MAG: RnfABCDGE type electron transport complex subunit D [Mariprofundaceae bacterium]|nr:RnfABCDGE type electron transport complex subunit D [Mariprofundaceae bacterium]